MRDIVIPHAIMNMTELISDEKLLLSYIMEECANSDFQVCKENNFQLADNIGVSYRSVYRYMEKLESLEYIKTCKFGKAQRDIEITNKLIGIVYPNLTKGGK